MPKTEPSKIKLQYPIETRDGKTLSHVTLKSPRAGKLRELAEYLEEAHEKRTSEIGLVMDALAIVSDLSPEEVDELHPADLAALGSSMGPLVETAAASLHGLPSGGAKTKTQ